MNDKEITIHILDNESSQGRSGTYSSSPNNLRAVVLDENSLQSSIQACETILNEVERTRNLDEFQVDSVNFSLGLSAQGKVGFLGCGASLTGTTSISISFKRRG